MGSRDKYDGTVEFTNEEYITILQSLQDWLYFCSMNGGTRLQREAIDKAIEVLSKPEPLQPKSGRWIIVTNGRGGHECDQCHEYAPSFQSGTENLSNFCPNCGAKMEETE